MARIGKADFEYIDRRLDEIEARIVSMQEFDEYGKEA
jgi:tetrahydromethanopterin S-methyltransferase subunit G